MSIRYFDRAFYVAKTTFFFLFVGGLVGTTFTLPFVETLTHRPFSFPESLLMMLLGYVVMGMPVAGFTGFLYGICLAAYRPAVVGRYFAAIACGVAPSLLLVAWAEIWNSERLGDSWVVLVCLTLFTGGSSLITAWIHRKSEQRLSLFRFPDWDRGQRLISRQAPDSLGS